MKKFVSMNVSLSLDLLVILPGECVSSFAEDQSARYIIRTCHSVTEPTGLVIIYCHLMSHCHARTNGKCATFHNIFLFRMYEEIVLTSVLVYCVMK